jgi:hypothetical protein
VGALYRLSLLAASLVLAAAGILLAADWPVVLGERAVTVCYEVTGLGGAPRMVCEERRFGVSRGSPLAAALGLSLVALSLALLLVMVREYLVRGLRYMARSLGGALRPRRPNPSKNSD